MKTILQGAVLALSKHEISKKGGATQKIYESSLEVLMLCQERDYYILSGKYLCNQKRRNQIPCSIKRKKIGSATY